MNTVKKLTELEVSNLEKSHVISDLRKAEDEIIKLRKCRIEDRKTILQMSIERISFESKNILDDEKELNKRKEIDNKARETILAEIKKRLNLKNSNFGYNPDTMEVVQE
jgi:hypothetical protein